MHLLPVHVGLGLIPVHANQTVVDPWVKSAKILLFQAPDFFLLVKEDFDIVISFSATNCAFFLCSVMVNQHSTWFYFVADCDLIQNFEIVSHYFFSSSFQDGGCVCCARHFGLRL